MPDFPDTGRWHKPCNGGNSMSATTTNHHPKRKPAAPKKPAVAETPLKRSPAEVLKSDLVNLRDDTVTAAKEYLLNPVVEAAEDTRDLIALRADAVERRINERVERTARWIASNPFTAVACSVAFGFVASKIFGRPK